ncbi:type II secretion system F family protein [Mucilaginibacter jinjuensis]|uniref:General secretion pathway protein F n=1 Tax=Mucilaginibacter jinjuensis TaxID=1176721 RepID=A0ABY7TBG3_9SPHI|nr:type II secretion system F family protein [Mucilaginibacter jinjuensis]WCT13653.1 type II secretion system F family protein [Mucilaginibacter jinjuensis]
MPSIDLRRYERKEIPKQKAKESGGSGIIELLNRDITFGKNELSDKKKESFYLELGSLLQAGINLKSSLELITADQTKQQDKQLLTNIQKAVLNGDALSVALKASTRFSLYETFSLQIGEETGKIIEVLNDLAKYYQTKIKQRRKIISALTYPCIVLATSVGAVTFMLKFIVPMFSEIFHRFGGQLPWITQKIVGLSNALENNFYQGLVCILIIIGVVFKIRDRPQFRKIVSSVVLKLPVVGNLVQKTYLARFCNSMRLLINAKLPLLKAIALIRQMINYYPIESALQIVEDDIMKGMPLHQSLQRFTIFPPKMIQLIKVGEETNQLDYFFARISEQYIEEVEYKTSTLSSAMEPLIILFLGFVVGIILLSMYLPLFQMSNILQ